MQGNREFNAIARSSERVGAYSITTSLSTTPVINKANYAGLSGVLVSGTPTSLEFHVSNGDSPYHLFREDYQGDENAFVAPQGIWAFEKVKIVANAACVYELRNMN